MKNRENYFSAMGHTALRTRHVFIENDQVFLKKSQNSNEEFFLEQEEWCPINFQWIPIFQLNDQILP